jgi:hypothetical protein
MKIMFIYLIYCAHQLMLLYKTKYRNIKNKYFISKHHLLPLTCDLIFIMKLLVGYCSKSVAYCHFIESPSLQNKVCKSALNLSKTQT